MQFTSSTFYRDLKYFSLKIPLSNVSSGNCRLCTISPARRNFLDISPLSSLCVLFVCFFFVRGRERDGEMWRRWCLVMVILLCISSAYFSSGFFLFDSVLYALLADSLAFCWHCQLRFDAHSCRLNSLCEIVNDIFMSMQYALKDILYYRTKFNVSPNKNQKPAKIAF